ncbi:MAG: putative N-acetylmannosamine-6-phosphate 2-epimerase [Gammaproteobacteria bacterium]|nr:putative N-acetylmannosamine-6-phosphate 2-epimerase [Gammaproteobacteria bacterium]
MARAAELAGAVGIRAEGARDIAAIRAAVELPIIGIRKILDGRPVYITPDLDLAAEVVRAGADIVAVDATLRPRGGPEPGELIGRIRAELQVPVMADIDGVAAAEAAAAAGADLVATTLSGYTGGPVPPEPDYRLIAELAGRLEVPVVAEGRLWTPEDVARAFEAGAWAVVVGTAVTNPMRITARLVAAAKGRQ